ncbi:DNA-directed RNA polymerase subunit A'', partial [Sulfolobus sp. E5]
MIDERDKQYLEEKAEKASSILPQKVVNDLKNLIVSKDVLISRDEIDKIFELAINEYSNGLV